MRNAKSVKKTVLRVLLYLAVIIICLITLYPYFVTICTALKSRAEIFSTSGTVFPVEAIWSNLIDVWSKAPSDSFLLLCPFLPLLHQGKIHPVHMTL